MQITNRVFVLIMALTLSGCAGLYEEQEPAPVMGQDSDPGSYDPYFGSQGYPPQPATPPPVLETKPLEGMDKPPEIIELKPELPPPVETPAGADLNQPGQTPDGLPELVPEQPVENNLPTSPDEAAVNQPELQPDTQPGAEPTPPPEAAVSPAPQAAPALPEPPPADSFTPLEELPQQTPAVNALVLAANDNTQAGKLDSAVSSIERAIRIEPRNAALYYKLAVLRLKQSKPRLAEDLARKAALLAVNDNNMKKHSWLLIANAREQQDNKAGAEAAKAEAAKY